jgi:hypothetical protein
LGGVGAGRTIRCEDLTAAFPPRLDLRYSFLLIEIYDDCNGADVVRSLRDFASMNSSFALD